MRMWLDRDLHWGAYTSSAESLAQGGRVLRAQGNSRVGANTFPSGTPPPERLSEHREGHQQ